MVTSSPAATVTSWPAAHRGVAARVDGHGAAGLDVRSLAGLYLVLAGAAPGLSLVAGLQGLVRDHHIPPGFDGRVPAGLHVAADDRDVAPGPHAQVARGLDGASLDNYVLAGWEEGEQ
jgi:hypothetical protein